MKLRMLAAAAVLALTLVGCGQKKESTTPTSNHLQPVSLMLDWFPNADHVGIYRALAEGDFARAGLDVHVQTPSDPSLPLKLLAAGKVDLAISYEPEVLLSRNQNSPVVSIAALVQRPLTSVLSIGPHPVNTGADLRGKRVGDAGIPYQHAYLQTILAGAGVPANSVRDINVGENLVPAMLSGHVDATLGGYWNYEAIQLDQLHKHPTVVPVDKLGVPPYDELVLVARQSTIVQRTDIVRRFVQALARGYESARRDPQAAVGNLVAANPGLDRSFQLASVQATLPAFFPSDPANPWGWQDPKQWSAYGQWMLSHHLITNPNAPVQASSNDFLAGVGP